MNQDVLFHLYIKQKMSVSQIAIELCCSQNKVNYWLNKHGIPKRTISEAIYIQRHPDGDPFSISPINTVERAILFGMGIGLYWGEGTKACKTAVRLGNTDPNLLKTFMNFLIECYRINKDDLRFGLQIFSDCNTDESLEYWTAELKVKRSQFYKVHVTISGSIGTYRKKSKYGVVTLYYHNSRLRNILVNHLYNMPR